MPYLPMYLLDEDIPLINEILDAEKEIAYLLADGDHQWIAKQAHAIIPDIGVQSSRRESTFKLPNFVEYALWHIPSGPLPLLNADKGFVDIHLLSKECIENPWQGWTEKRSGANLNLPNFGVCHPGIIHLKLKLPLTDEIRISSFGWIGNRYAKVGKGADESTKKFWDKLKRTLRKNAVRIPRNNNIQWKNEILAFPQAYKEIKNGRPCAINP